MSDYPTSPFAHRDCCIGVSFPLVALEKYPDWRKKPARLIEAQKILTEIQGLLEVSRFSAGEKRALQTSCEAAADAIDAYDADHSQTRDDAYSSWCVMWFLGDEAFADALYYGGPWKKRPELWLQASTLSAKLRTDSIRTTWKKPKRPHESGTVTHRRDTMRNLKSYGLEQRSNHERERQQILVHLGEQLLADRDVLRPARRLGYACQGFGWERRLLVRAPDRRDDKAGP